MALNQYDFDKNRSWQEYCRSKVEGVPHSISDPYLVGGPDVVGWFEIFYDTIHNQGCSMPEEAPRVCDFCCNCDESRQDGIAAEDQDDDDSDSDDEYIWHEFDELRPQIQRQNFEIVYNAEKNWIVYKYPLCRMCWEREREFQQA